MAIVQRRNENDPLVTTTPTVPTETPGVTTNTKVCAECSDRFIPSGKNQKFCQTCRALRNASGLGKKKSKIQKLRPMSFDETKSCAPLIEAAVALVKLCTEHGVEHAVEFYIGSVKVTVSK